MPRSTLWLSFALAGAGEGLWILSWIRAEGEPLLPARAIWVWPLSWVVCLGVGSALAWWAPRVTGRDMHGMALAGGMLAQLLSQVLMLGVPLLVLFFAAASVVASS